MFLILSFENPSLWGLVRILQGLARVRVEEAAQGTFNRHGAGLAWLLQTVEAYVAVLVADVAKEGWNPRDGNLGDRS